MWWVIAICVVLVSTLVQLLLGSGTTAPQEGTCGARDDVNDPAYNMRNVVVQSVLLEEHLSDEAKYCRSCIVKHFAHIEGLLREAKWMAGGGHRKYALLDESIRVYSDAFAEWLRGRDDRARVLQVLDAVRAQRRLLSDQYYLSAAA